MGEKVRKPQNPGINPEAGLTKMQRRVLNADNLRSKTFKCGGDIFVAAQHEGKRKQERRLKELKLLERNIYLPYINENI